MKIPITILLDDPAPVVSCFYQMACSGVTGIQRAKLYKETDDGRPLLKTNSNEFLYQFCDIIEKHGIKGKFSVVPMPGNQGDIVNGLVGVDPQEVAEWLDVVKKRVAPQFAICPEMLTHNLAVDLKTGNALDISEDAWSQTQNKETLTPYIAKALSLLRDAGFDAFGVTSPWRFAWNVLDEYVPAISQAVYDVTGKTQAWYSLGGLAGKPNAKPWVQYEDQGRIVVSIPKTIGDFLWQTINTPDDSQEYVSRIADIVITADGKEGEIIHALELGSWPIICTHWQSLISNGLGTGLRVLDEVARRIDEHLSDTVTWMSVEEIMKMVAENKADYPKRTDT